MIAFEEIRERLEKYEQTQLLKYWAELNEEQRTELLNDIGQLDLDELQSFYERATNELADNGNKLDDRLQPIPESQLLSIGRTPKEQIRLYEEEGLRQIAQNRVGVLLMAGGQGTRLGSKNPKGMFCVGLQSGRSLFRIQAERMLSLQRLSHELTGQHGRITWYIMTSEHTMEPTRAFFEKNNFFGLCEEDIYMFEQGSLPCYGFDGKILLDEKHRVSTAPDGNGGIYRALRSQGVLADMARRGVMYLHAHSVDNILIKVADPVFIGYCVKQNADCAAKVVEKSQPNEAVGVICIVDGLYQVVEYSEISTKTSEMRNADGRLTFNAGNICNHLFTAEFLERIASTYESKLKLHVAKKKIPFVDNSGIRLTPDKPNGIKIEKFVFDVFEFAEKFVAVEVGRDEEFSPLKNAESAGKECASTARASIHKLHKKFIEDAGGIVHGDECEISPLLSYFGEGLETIVKDNSFTSPVYLKCSLDQSNGHC